MVTLLFPFPLVINDLILHNHMLDLGASTNVMTIKVMNQLSLKTTYLYTNVHYGLERDQSMCFN